MDKARKNKSRRRWTLVRRRECLVPTWRGWLLLFLTLGVVTLFTVRAAHSFLSVTERLPGGVLVVEGWMPDRGLMSAIEEFKSNHYEKIFVTGGPLDMGGPLLEYKTYAEMGAATLTKLGFNTNLMVAVPSPWVRKDRTYNSAVSLKKWFTDHAMQPDKVTLVTEGPHARRSRLLFSKALGKNVKVGVVALQPDAYDPKHWWRYSHGVRAVIGEGLAYGYARVLFNDARE